MELPKLELEIPRENEGVTSSYHPLVYATKARRFGAAVADGIVMALFLVSSMAITMKLMPILLVLLPPSVLDLPNKKIFAQILNFAFNLTFNLGFFTLMEGSFLQGSPGKILFGLCVVDTNGWRITYLHALVRNFSKVLHFLTIIAFLLPADLSGLVLPVTPSRTIAATPDLETGTLLFGGLLLLSTLLLASRRMLYDFLSGTKVVRTVSRKH